MAREGFFQKIKNFLFGESEEAITEFSQPEEADVSIPVPACNYLLTPLLTVLPTQLIAYRTALALGCDVDRPRNLAKSVTVE